MHHIILNTNKIVPLQQYIDNTNSNIKVGLRSISYNVGWYNINYESVKWQKGSGGLIEFIIQPGLYSFYDLQNILLNIGVHLKLNINNMNGTAIMSVPTGYTVILTSGLSQMLGLTGKVFHDGITYIGIRPINFNPFNSLYIHLNQVNTKHNFYNGVPSDLIGIIPVENKSFGSAVNVHYEHPMFRNLADGTISELEIRVTDGNNNIIENHGLPICIELEFI